MSRESHKQPRVFLLDVSSTTKCPTLLGSWKYLAKIADTNTRTSLHGGLGDANKLPQKIAA